MSRSATPRQQYLSRLQTRSAALATKLTWKSRFEKLLGIAFAAGVVVAFLAFGPASVSPLWLLAPVAAFALCNALLGKVQMARDNLDRAMKFYQRGLARLDGQWTGSGESGSRFLSPHHLFSKDLDIFGPGSLFQLLCAARTRIGEDVLAGWLLYPASPSTVYARQQAVAEITPRLDLREDLAVLAENAREGFHPDALKAWGEREPILKPSAFRHFAWILSCFGAIAALALFTNLLAQFGLFRLTGRVETGIRIDLLLTLLIFTPMLHHFNKRTDRILGAAEEAVSDLALLAGVLARLEAERFTSPRLTAVRAELDTAGIPPSRRIAKLNRLMELADSRHHRLMAVLGPLLLWDIHLAYAIEDWRRISGKAMRRWLEAAGELEALSSLASYAYEHPAAVFPELITGSSPYFEAEAMAHPLIPEDRAIANDVSLNSETRLLIVSGSNMSGKSTLLRAVGVNAVLAQAGAPVPARSFTLSPLAVGASIQIIDSLQEGTSHFYAEISRLRLIMEAAAGPVPVLFLIDEILHGTNSHDRRIGAEGIVRSLLQRCAIGLITTHDLALTEVAVTGARNVHFTDTLEAGTMHFDYKMHDGVVKKSNALELMRSVGLNV